VSKAQIKAKLADTFKCKEVCIVVYGLKTKFGGGHSTGFAFVYDSEDMRKKYDSKKNLKKVNLPSYLITGRYDKEKVKISQARKGNQR